MRWNKRDEENKHFSDHRILDHGGAMQRAYEFLHEELAQSSTILFQFCRAAIILTTTDDRFVDTMRTVAKLCVQEMEYSGFYLFKEFNIVD